MALRKHVPEHFFSARGIHEGLLRRQHTVELHEHIVPNFDVTVAVLIGRSRRAASDVVAVVVEDLAAGAAWAGVGHLPEIVRCVRRALVVADADDAVGRQPDLLVPDVEGFVVGVIDRDQQLLFRQAPHAGQQLPGVGDGIALEVVAEAEIAQHFEEGVVAGGVADLVEVVVLAAGAHAALAGRGAGVAALLGAQEHVLELDHAGVGEQQGRVVARHQRARRHHGVALRAEEFEEVLADL